MTTADPDRDRIFGRLKTVARHSAVYGIFDALGKLGTIFLVPMYTRVLGPTEYGALELYQVTYALLVILGSLGFGSSITKYYLVTESQAERDRFLRTAWTSVFVAAGVLTTILCLLAAPIGQVMHGTPAAAFQWRILFLTAFVDALLTLILALFRAQERPFRYSMTNLVRLMVALTLNVVSVGVLHWGVAGVLVSNLAGALVGMALAYIPARRHLSFRWSGEAFRPLARFGFPLVLGGGAIFVMANGDRYFLRAFAEPGELGVYSLAYKFGMVMTLLVNAFVVAWPPLLFQIAKEPTARETFARVLVYYLLVTLPVFLVLTAFRKELVSLVGTEAFRPAAGVLGFILAAYLFYGLYYLFSVGVVLKDKTHTIPMILAVCVAVSAGLNYLLVPRFGVKGAGFTIVVSYALLALQMFLVSRRYYAIPYEAGKVLRLALLAVALFGACVGLVHGTSWAAGAVKVLILGLYLPGIVWLRVVDPEETARLRKLVGRRLSRPAAR